jgi:hypothetical protein
MMQTLHILKLISPSFEWTDFYGNVTEAIPTNAPEPRRNPVQMTAFVDANHAGNQVTHRSHTGILIYCNSVPIGIPMQKPLLKHQHLGLNLSP